MNTINLVEKYLPILDEQYKAESKSAILDMANEFIQDTKDSKKYKIAKLSVDGLADYNRGTGFVTGDAQLTWEEHEYTIDRGRAIQIDDMDNEETFGLAFGRLAGEFQRTNVIPEMDAYRFAKYYTKAGYKTSVTATATNVLEVIDELDAKMDDAEVPEDGRILFVSPTIYKMMLNDSQLEKHITVDGIDDKAVNKKMFYYDGHLIVKVPAGRFYTSVTLKEGGFDGTGTIGILMVQKDAVAQNAKRRIARIWAPSREQAVGCDGVNPNADAWKFDYRLYHDAFVLENKVNGIAAAELKAE